MISDSKHWEGQISLLWDGESGGEINFINHSKLKIDTPLEHGGKGKHPSPGELLFSAIGGSLLTTFLYMKRKVQLHLEELQISVSGNVNLSGPEGYRITDLKAFLRIKTVKREEANAKKCVEWAKHYCYIIHALTVPVKIEQKIEII